MRHLIPTRRTLSRILGATAMVVAGWLAGRWSVGHLARANEHPRVQECAGGTWQGLALPPRARREGAISTVPVGLVALGGDIQLVGTVSYDQDHLAMVGPFVAGRIARLLVGVGDRVKRGQVLAEIESADVGQARADLISARARAAASEANLRRESELAAKHISSERERELAEAQWLSEQAAFRAASERLLAIGFSLADISTLEAGARGGRVPLRAPIDGVVLRRPVTLGQAVERATDAFQIADTAHVWIDLDLYEKDLPRVRVGQRVEIRADAHPSETFSGRVALVVPQVDEATRTAKVRIELANEHGKLSFGQLVTARLTVGAAGGAAPVLAVPRASVQRVDGRTALFVKTAGGGFERRFVELGSATGDQVEIRKGVDQGDLVVAEGAFLLKSELLR